jgi:hypothetical protein
LKKRGKEMTSTSARSRRQGAESGANFLRTIARLADEQQKPRSGAKTAYVEQMNPQWENRYCEGFNDKLRDEGDIFTLRRR